MQEDSGVNILTRSHPNPDRLWQFAEGSQMSLDSSEMRWRGAVLSDIDSAKVFLTLALASPTLVTFDLNVGRCRPN